MVVFVIVLLKVNMLLFGPPLNVPHPDTEKSCQPSAAILEIICVIDVAYVASSRTDIICVSYSHSAESGTADTFTVSTLCGASFDTVIFTVWRLGKLHAMVPGFVFCTTVILNSKMTTNVGTVCFQQLWRIQPSPGIDLLSTI